MRVYSRPADREAAGVAFVVGPKHDVDVMSAGCQVVGQLVATELTQQWTRRVGAVIYSQTIRYTVACIFQFQKIKGNRD